MDQESEQMVKKMTANQTKKSVVNNNNKSTTTILFNLLLIIIASLFLLFLFFFIHYGNHKAHILVSEKDIIKPENDHRTYRVVHLSNNLELTLISDLNTKKCSASMAVGVGTFQDDDDTNGLAHFFEHMLFLGSKSFPSPSSFDNHLTNFFGTTNAFTQEETTIFYFDVGEKGFDTALHMFSRIFAEPLLDFSLMNKEIQAVNSENDKNLNNDNWRRHQLIKSLANPRHPYSKFGTGNKQTLGSIEGKILHSKIERFYKKYYVPANMKLVLQGNVEMDLLQKMATKYFSDIRLDTQQDDPIIQYGHINTFEKAFYRENLGKAIWYQKLSSSISLDFIFVIEEIISKYKTKPYEYITYILNYSAERSFVNYLKQNKWVTKMNSGILQTFTSFSEFTISLTLTENGLKNVDKIVEHVYGYLAMIRNQGVNHEIFKDIKTIRENNFRFMNKKSEYGKYLASLAQNMFDYEYRDILYGDYCITTFDESIIKTFMNQLIVENSLMLLGSEVFPHNSTIEKFFNNTTNKTEKWYSTIYRENKFTDSQIYAYSKFSNELEKSFILRPLNKFITSENQLLKCMNEECFSSKDTIIPKLYYETDNIKIWEKVWFILNKIDKTFLIPKVNLYITYLIKNMKESPIDSTITHMFFNYLQLTLGTKLSEAIDAGNMVKAELNDNGLQITLEAYSDVVERIFKVVNEVVFNSTISENLFREIVEITYNDLKMKENSAPYLKGFMIFNKIIIQNNTDYSENLNSLKSIGYDKFTNSLNSFKKAIMFKALFYGNFDIHIIDNIRQYLTQYLPLTTKINNVIDYETQVRNITTPYIFRTKNDLASEINHVIVNFYQIAVKEDYKLSLISNILELFWGNFFYYNLRTMKQLGYIVNTSKFIQNNVMYFRIIIQGTKATPDVMNHEIDNVISLLSEKVKTMTQTTVDQYKESIHMMLFKPEDNLKERSMGIWNEIKEDSYSFKRKEKLNEELAKIKAKEVISAFNSIFFNDPKKISIQLFAGNANITSISNNITEDYILNKKFKNIVSNKFTDYQKLPILTIPKYNYEQLKNDENNKKTPEKGKRLLKNQTK